VKGRRSRRFVSAGVSGYKSGLRDSESILSTSNTLLQGEDEIPSVLEIRHSDVVT
jgi:hypothetical protein